MKTREREREKERGGEREREGGEQKKKKRTRKTSTHSDFWQAILQKAGHFLRVVTHEARPVGVGSIELKHVKVTLLVELMQQRQLLLHTRQIQPTD